MTLQRLTPAFSLAAAAFALVLLFATTPIDAQDQPGRLSVITFPEAPTVEQLESLEAAGLRLGRYLGDGSYYIRLSGSGRLALPASVQLRNAEPEDKYRLLDTVIGKVSMARLVSLRGYFAEGTDFVTIRRQIEAHGGNISATEWNYSTNSVEFAIPAGAIENFAASDNVLALAPALKRKTHNTTSAVRSNIDTARNEYGLTGNGIKVAVVDSGAVHIDHPDFGERVTLGEDGGTSSHSTHVTGTVLGSGEGNANAQGMAFEATGVSFNFNDSTSKFFRAADEFGVHVINNSWGATIGWDFSSERNRWEFWENRYLFGAYLTQTGGVDKFVRERGTIVIFSAGNDRGDTGTTDGNYWKRNDDQDFDQVTDDPNPPAPDGPFRSIDIYGAAKNVITVGATDRADAMTDFSAWGPAADGRIKPEVVAQGAFTLSPSGPTGYSFFGGTSMAAPVVSGGAALLIEQFIGLQNRVPTPHELKGILVATATDLGNAGPDYIFGFGLLDVHKAAELIERDDDENTIVTDSIRKFKKAKRNKPVYYRFSLPSGVKNLKVALVWTDPEGPGAQVVGDIIGRQVPMLMNDLDLRLYWIKERKKKDKVKDYEPYILDPDNPSSTAKKGNNTLDNLEMVEIKNPKSGNWFIEISAGTFKDGKKQDFAIIVYTDKTISSAVEEADQPGALETN